MLNNDICVLEIKRVSRLIAGIFLLAFLCVFLMPESAIGASPNAHHKMSGDLNDMISRKSGPGLKKIIFYAKDLDAASAYIISHGGIILRRHKNLITAKVPVNNIDDIVGSSPGISYARLPRKFFPCQTTSEGVHITQADTIQAAGITGSGVKIAVLDLGFTGLANAISKSELPPNVITYDFVGDGIELGGVHGIACGEIVYDMAPGAQIYLLKVADETDIIDAAAYCEANSIKIVTASIGTFGTGPGDGTGPVDELCDDLKAKGILFVTAAGNYGNTFSGPIPIGTHWRGTFIDSGRNFSYNGTSNEENQFVPGDPNSWYNVINATVASDISGNKFTEVNAAMRWDDWPTGTSDYDIFLLDNDTGAVVASSTTVQDGSQPPVEYLSFSAPGTQSKLYKLLVTKKTGSPAGKEVEIVLNGPCYFVPFGSYASPIATSIGSLGEPADSASVLTVGAINYKKWTTGPEEDFSSQGPTNAWAGSSSRAKPDICGPDGTSSLTYGANGFFGTSAATPHAAGAAALILAMHPQYSVDQLISALEVNAIDMGDPGKDNIYGNGRMVANKLLLNTPPTLDWTGEPGYVSGGVTPESGNGSTPITFRVKYTDADGDAPAIYKLYIDRNGNGNYADAGEVVDMIATGSDHKSGVIYTYTTNIPYSSGSTNCSYYFSFSDRVDPATGNITNAISPQTAINKPDIFQSLSLEIDRTNWQLSGIPAGSEYVMDSSGKFRVSNDGDGPETYSLQMTSAGSGWSASGSKDGADVNKFVLSALFSAVSDTGIDSSYFNEAGNNDVVLPSGAIRASAVNFGSSRLSAGGFSVLPGNDRNLWIDFKAPVKDTVRATQSISVTINAEAQ